MVFDGIAQNFVAKLCFAENKKQTHETFYKWNEHFSYMQ